MKKEKKKELIEKQREREKVYLSVSLSTCTPLVQGEIKEKVQLFASRINDINDQEVHKV